jgi:hypothetical protein
LTLTPRCYRRRCKQRCPVHKPKPRPANAEWGFVLGGDGRKRTAVGIAADGKDEKLTKPDIEKSVEQLNLPLEM